MTTAILDTNVLVQAVIGSPRGASTRSLRAYRERRFRLVFSRDTLDELAAILTAPMIRKRLDWSDQELRAHLTFLLANSLYRTPHQRVSATVTRDVTDTKFLALAAASDADFLVTNDRRHLLPLKRFGRTRIVTPTQFLKALTRSTS